MATELIGVEGMTPELKQTYDRRLLMRLQRDIVFLQYGEKRPIPARGGKSIEFRRMEKITVTGGSYTLTEGTNPTETSSTITSVACTISQYGQFTKISDLLETQGFDPVVAEYVDAYGEAMAEGLDIVVRDTLSAATNIQYADTATVVGTSGAGAVGSGNYFDAAEVREAVRTLRRNGARKINNRYLCFLHPDNTKDLFEDPDIVDSFQQAAARGPDNPMFSGVLGDWAGVRFVETNNLRIRSSYGMSGADVYEVYVFGQQYYGVSDLSANAARTIIHSKELEGGPLEMYSTVGWKAALAACILNQNFGVLINCASSRSNSA